MISGLSVQAFEIGHYIAIELEIPHSDINYHLYIFKYYN